MVETPVLELLTKEISEKLAGQKHDASGTPIQVGYSHGPGGTFTFPGVDPTVFHTVLGHRGILGQLPTRATNFTDPTYFTLTGVGADAGSEKDEPCEDAPVAGLAKGCLVPSAYGRYERATPELELNRLGQFNDRADPMDLSLVGSPIQNTSLFTTFPGGNATPADVLRNEISRKFWELGISFQRLLAKQLWQGSPVNNLGDSYREMTGLATLVNTGYKDAITGQACAAMDSDVKNFGYNRFDNDADGVNIVRLMSAMFHYLEDLASRTGVLPVRWVIAMRPELFWELTSIWPCSYLTYRCEIAGNTQLNIDATDQVRMRDEMRAGNYLLIDGMRIQVVLDDGIAELDGSSSGGNFPNGCFASDIYILPMSVIGGQSSLFLEYFDYNNTALSQALGQAGVLGRVNGPFLYWPRQKNQCVSWQAKTEPRLVLRTPWLAGRLQNVVYCPEQHVRDAFPESPYFVDGGVTSRPGPSYYAMWQS